MEAAAMFHAKLIEIYLAALPRTVVSIVTVADGNGARIETGDVPAGAIVHARLHFNKSHADLVLSACGLDGRAEMSPSELIEAIPSAATRLGATWQTDEEARAAAAKAVQAIVDKVEAARQAGGMKEINASYKRYRQQQVAKAERAIPYSAYLRRYTELMVREVAERAVR
jgi:hypothetical protein